MSLKLVKYPVALPLRRGELYKYPPSIVEIDSLTGLPTTLALVLGAINVLSNKGARFTIAPFA